MSLKPDVNAGHMEEMRAVCEMFLSNPLLQIHPNKLHNPYQIQINHLFHSSFCTERWEGSVQYRSQVLGYGTGEMDHQGCLHAIFSFSELGFWTSLFDRKCTAVVDALIGGKLNKRNMLQKAHTKSYS